MRSAPTSSCTQRSALEPAGADMTVCVGLDVGTTGVKAIAVSPDGRCRSASRARLSALDAAPGLVGAGSRGLVGAPPRRRSRRCRPAGRSSASASRGRCTGWSPSTPRACHPARDPLERSAHRGRVRRDRGARRARAAHRAHRQPRAHRVHRAEAPLAPRPRARVLCADRTRDAAEGLRPTEADRRVGD